MKTIAIDFDGVIHDYAEGWKDGSIYGNPVPGAFDAINHLMKAGYAVFIFSTRERGQIFDWLYKQNAGITYTVIDPYLQFWNRPGVVGITDRKLPAIAYIDDRAIKFNGDWNDALMEVEGFKTYQQGLASHSVEVLKIRLKEDPDFWQVWKSNIAVAFQEAYTSFDIEHERDQMNAKDIHQISNNAAQFFLNELTR